MLYGLIRVLIGILIFGLAVIGILKSKIRKKKGFTISFFILSIIIIFISGLFPIENTFITFDSPKEVFYYTQIGEIKDTIYGNNSCMIVYLSQNGSYSYVIIPKIEEGYKIGSSFSNVAICKTLAQGNSAQILNLKGTTDYYLWATFISENPDITISDSNHSSFKHILNRGENINTFISYGFIDTLNNNYCLTLDNNEIFNLKRI